MYYNQVAGSSSTTRVVFAWYDTTFRECCFSSEEKSLCNIFDPDDFTTTVVSEFKEYTEPGSKTVNAANQKYGPIMLWRPRDECPPAPLPTPAPTPAPTPTPTPAPTPAMDCATIPNKCTCSRDTCAGAVLVGTKTWPGGSKTVSCGFDCKRCRLTGKSPFTDCCNDGFTITTGGGSVTVFRAANPVGTGNSNTWGQPLCVYCDGDEDNFVGRVCN